jgi:hypothetical protein
MTLPLIVVGWWIVTAVIVVAVGIIVVWIVAVVVGITDTLHLVVVNY